MFEVIAILFVILGILSSILQSAKRNKQVGTGSPPGTKPQPVETIIEKNLSDTKIKRISRKPTPKPIELVFPEQISKIPSSRSAVQETNPEEDVFTEYVFDQKSLMKGIIFSVILSQPKCKGVRSFF